MKQNLSRLQCVGFFLAASACVLWGGAEPLTAQTIPDFTGKDWGGYQTDLNAEFGAAGISPTIEVIGLGGAILSSPQSGDAVVGVSPPAGSPVSATTVVTVTVARFKLPNYMDEDNPIPLLTAVSWLKFVDPSINISQIVKLPDEEHPFPPPLEWWSHVLSLIKMPDKDGTNQLPGAEIPAGATIALFVTDPPGLSFFDLDEATLLIIANIIILLIGLTAFMQAWRAWKAAKENKR